MAPAQITGRSCTVRGFTILELLTVIAIIGILAAILIPTVTGSQTSAKRAKTKVQFNQWAVAIEGFRSEYGYYPDFSTAGGTPSSTEFPTGKIDNALQTRRFVEALSGRRLDGATLVANDPGIIAGNTKRIAFLSIGSGELNASSILQDAFQLPSPEIVVMVDKNGDGFVRDSTGTNPDYTTPAPQVKGFSPEFPTTGVRAGVIFYSPGAGQTASDIIKSWE